MNTDPVVNFYIRPDGRFGRSAALPDGVILLATGRQSRIDTLVRHTALRDEQAKCYRLPPQPERVAGVPNDVRAGVAQYIDWVRGNPLGKGITFEVIK
jgi:hypothetical protein